MPRRVKPPIPWDSRRFSDGWRGLLANDLPDLPKQTLAGGEVDMLALCLAVSILEDERERREREQRERHGRD
jgi:hypothetical protein